MSLEKSFSLMRTNPKLSGNVKIVFDKNGRIYLESFNSNSALRQQRYKHFRVRDNIYFKEAVQDFFENSDTDTIFGVRDISDESISYTDHRYQFDDIYFSGAMFTEDNYYDEEYEYFAPLHIKKGDIPENFIILRVDGTGMNEIPTSGDNFRDRILNNWKFVDEYELKTDNIISQWFDMNFVLDSDYPQIPMGIKHGDIQMSLLNGLDVKNSGYVTRYINLNEVQTKNTPIFKTEEYFTDMWRNNGVLYPNILNLKFLFDDTPATPDTLKKYSINRYLGFYIDKKEQIKDISPYQATELSGVKTPSDFAGMNAEKISEIPFIENNLFLREKNGVLYSHKPIIGEWDNNIGYWIEYNGSYYKIIRTKNNNESFSTSNIIGSYIYSIVSDKILQRVDISYDLGLTDSAEQIRHRILLSDLGNYFGDSIGTSDRVIIKYDTEKGNVIENVCTTKVRFRRNYNYYTDSQGNRKFGYTIESDSYENIFSIDGFDSYDLHMMNILDKKFIIKKSNEGYYYLNCDHAINADNEKIEYWINSGKQNNNEFYTNENISSLTYKEKVPMFSITRYSFSDIKDFDFDRTETDFSKYEYEKEYEIKQDTQPKLYMKEFSTKPVSIHTIKKDTARRIPIYDINSRPLYLREQREEVNLSTGELYTANELFFKDIDGQWKLYNGLIDGTSWYSYNRQDINLPMDYYREENYIFRVENEDGAELGYIDFKANGDSSKIYEELSWGEDGNNLISDTKTPLPELKFKNPNEAPDINYVPLSSEYVNSLELFELDNSDSLTDIWSKNQSVCKWGYSDSVCRNFYPYRLNYSFDLGVFNFCPSMDTGLAYPAMKYMDLEYFTRVYRDSISYSNYSIHIPTDGFNQDEYISNEYDYFTSVNSSVINFSNGDNIIKNYSIINTINAYETPSALYRGVKYLISDVRSISIDQEELSETGNVLIEEINKELTDYSGYKLSVFFSRKKSSSLFNPGMNTNKGGIDVYLNEKWKNIFIHLYVDTDNILEIFNKDTGERINAETCEISKWYDDNISSLESDPQKWEQYKFFSNGESLNIRPRDFQLRNILDILENPNFNSTGNFLPVQFIRIKEDSQEIMDYTNTDFIIETSEPDEVLINKDAYNTQPYNTIPEFDINNTLEKRKIKDDDQFSPLNNDNFTSDGLVVDSIEDINAYNDYSISYKISDSKDQTYSWELNDNTDLSIFRYSGAYTPIFKDIPLFKPYTKDISTGNWKFCDPSSGYNLKSFGMIDELIFSKCNRDTSILKIQSDSEKEKSVYPMVDEYGYEFDSRFIFASSWEKGYHYESRKIEVEPNNEISSAGYCIHFDGITENLVIKDSEKFNNENILCENSNYTNFLDKIPQNIGYKNITIKDLRNQTLVGTYTEYMRMVKDQTYNIRSYQTGYLNKPLTMHINIKFEHPTDKSKPDLLYSNYAVSNSQTVNYNIITNKYNYAPVSSPSYNIPIPEDYYINNELIVKVVYYAINGVEDEYSDFDINIVYDNDKNNLIINTGDVYSTLDISDKLYGGFFKLESESGNIYDYYEKCLKSEADVFTMDELDEWDKSSGPTDTDVYSNLWREFAGVENKKGNPPVISNPTPRIGRVGVEPYDYNTYPIPKNWNGDTYIAILNNLKDGSGDELENQIKNNSIYGYDSFVNTSIDLYNNKKFDRSCLYHFLEYASQEDDGNTGIEYWNIKLGADKILNEFYKKTGFGSLYEKGFSVKRLSNAFDIDLLNDETFLFEPNTDSYLENGNNIIYIGKVPEENTECFSVLRWIKIYRDDSIKFKLYSHTGDIYNIDVPVVSENGNRYTINEIFTEMNSQLTGSGSLIQDISDITVNNTEVFIKIKANESGSFYNFTIEIDNTIADTTLYEDNQCEEKKYTSVIYNKSSLRDDRNTGFTDAVTIEFFIKAENWVRPYETVMYKGIEYQGNIWDKNFTDCSWAIGRYGDTDRIAFKTVHEDLNNNKISHILPSVDDINDGKMHHVAFTFDVRTKQKKIYIDGVENSICDNFLPSDPVVSEREQAAVFMENRSRFIYGDNHISIGNEQSLANSIRTSQNDSDTIYWYNILTGIIQPDMEDDIWMEKNWSCKLKTAFEIFKEYYNSMKYYIHNDSENLSYDIVIGSSSSVYTGVYNFGGLIDELRIWNYSRSSKEISYAWRYIIEPSSFMDPLKSCICYYRFDEGHASTDTIYDMMNNYYISKADKWSMCRQDVIDDGNSVSETTDKKYFIFEKEYYTDSSIDIGTDRDWAVSEASIEGRSNEINPNHAEQPSLSIGISKPDILNESQPILLKRRRRKILKNIKKDIFNNSKRRDYRFKPVKWWEYKTLKEIKNYKETSSASKVNTRRRGREWINKVKKLTKKKR